MAKVWEREIYSNISHVLENDQNVHQIQQIAKKNLISNSKHKNPVSKLARW
jgi:hypothetical protein